MSGHSKWSSIKRAKGTTDAKRGALFTKLGREISVSARDGADPTANSRLRLAISRARDANMPMDTIERAIKRGAGAGEGSNYQEISYEGYGPAGAAVLVDALTDNRNRAAAEVRSVFNRNGGNLGESGSVRWLFDSKGIIVADPGNVDADELALLAIDAGAEDVQQIDEVLEIYTETQQLEAVRQALEAEGIQILSSESSMIPQTNVELQGKDAEQMMRLLDRLEDLDDVQRVYSNSVIPDEIASALAG